MKITVVGAGIIGLATAYSLSNNDHEVKIIAEKFSPNTTSNRAAAFWFPYHIRNDERGINWCRQSYEAYKKFTSDVATGVSMQKLLKAVPPCNTEDSSWISFMPQDSYTILEKQKIPAGYETAYEADVPLIETQIFLPWLMNELKKREVIVQEKKINTLYEIKDTDLIINCTAMGAQQLCDDATLIPIRGQVALLSPEKFPYIFLDNELPLYVVPRRDALIIGGTFEEGIDDPVCEPPTIDKILKNAYNLFPELKKQKVIGSWAGLRPYRPTVRLETEKNIIHNYGHGGSGFTLAWGCAEEVVKLVEKI